MADGAETEETETEETEEMAKAKMKEVEDQKIMQAHRTQAERFDARRRWAIEVETERPSRTRGRSGSGRRSICKDWIRT